jgi:hypothetical protein
MTISTMAARHKHKGQDKDKEVYPRLSSPRPHESSSLNLDVRDFSNTGKQLGVSPNTTSNAQDNHAT